MKYYFQLFFAIIFLIAYLAMTYFLWDNDGNYVFNGILVLGCSYSVYLIIRILKNYSKIKSEKNKVFNRTLFGVYTYNLYRLKAWDSEHNSYRVRYLKVTLVFEDFTVKIIDTADPLNAEKLYHYLRTHYINIYGFNKNE